MKNNVGRVDRIIRIALAVLLVVLNLNGTITGGWAIAAWVAVAILVLTAIFGMCPAYRLIGVNSCRTR